MPISRKTKQVAIANGASLSGALYFGASRLHTLQIPAAIDGTQVTFQASADGGTTWADLYDNGTELAFTIAASRVVLVDPAKFRGVQWLKVRTGTSAAPTAQTGARTLIAVSVPVEC